MGLREKLNDNPTMTAGGIAVVVLAIFAAIYFTSGGLQALPSEASGPAKVFFTDDDGTTWFADDAKKVPPFDHNGKPAYRAEVHKCDGKTYVNYMHRFTADTKKKVEAALASKATAMDPTLMEALDMAGKEVKAPGQKDWVRMSDTTRATAIITPKCKSGNFQLVSP